MIKTIQNYGKSVKERLLNVSRDEHYGLQMLLSRYFQERLLYRLSVSEYKDRFIFKGDALLYAHNGFQARPTLEKAKSPIPPWSSLSLTNVSTEKYGGSNSR